MTVDEVVKQLDVWITRHQRHAWNPCVKIGEPGAPTGSRFGGVPWFAEHEAWPACGVCHRPMQFFLQLNLAELPRSWKGKPDYGLLQLFYCIGDDCETERDSWEPFDPGHLVRILFPNNDRPGSANHAAQSPFPVRTITGWEHLTDLPHPEDHRELGLDYTYDSDAGTVQIECADPVLKIGPVGREATNKDGFHVAEAIGQCLEGDKLGGWPCWAQGAEYPVCPECAGRMMLLLQVDSCDNVPFMFGDAGCAHITQCPRHPQRLAFGWACG